MRKMIGIAAENDFTLTLQLIAGLDNSIADSLSRFQEKRFRQLAPNARLLPEKLPDLLPQLQLAFKVKLSLVWAKPLKL